MKGSITSQTAFSVMFCISDDGQNLPMYIVYKVQHMWRTWVYQGPEDARYNSTNSDGQMNTPSVNGFTLFNLGVSSVKGEKNC